MIINEAYIQRIYLVETPYLVDKVIQSAIIRALSRSGISKVGVSSASSLESLSFTATDSSD